jgi:hypothetical protein
MKKGFKKILTLLTNNQRVHTLIHTVRTKDQILISFIASWLKMKKKESMNAAADMNLHDYHEE